VDSLEKARYVIAPPLIGEQTVRNIVEAELQQSIPPPLRESATLIRIRHRKEAEIVYSVPKRS
jgi:hypothetical protein